MTPGNLNIFEKQAKLIEKLESERKINTKNDSFFAHSFMSVFKLEKQAWINQVGKQSTGITAKNNIIKKLAEIAKIKVKAKNFPFNEELVNIEIEPDGTEILDFTNELDKENNPIENKNRNTLGITVDVEKNPELAFKTNFVPALLNFRLLLDNIGLSDKNTILFLKQPIINKMLEDFYKSQINNPLNTFNKYLIGQARFARNYINNNKSTITEIEKKYGIELKTNSKITPKIMKILESAISSEFANYIENGIEPVFSNEKDKKAFENYKIIQKFVIVKLNQLRDSSASLIELGSAIDADTSPTTKSITQTNNKKNKSEEIRLSDTFINIKNLFNNTFIGGIINTRNRIVDVYKDLFITQNPRVKKALNDLYDNLGMNFGSTDKKERNYKLLEVAFIEWLNNTTPLANGKTIQEELPSIMKNINKQFEDTLKALPNNKILKDTIVTINDDITTVALKVSIFDESTPSELNNDFIDIYNQNKDLALNLVKLSLAQGLNYSPTLLSKIVPSDLYHEVIGSAFKDLNDTIEIKNLNAFANQFIRNYANYDFITKASDIKGINVKSIITQISQGKFLNLDIGGQTGNKIFTIKFNDSVNDESPDFNTYIIGLSEGKWNVLQRLGVYDSIKGNFVKEWSNLDNYQSQLNVNKGLPIFDINFEKEAELKEKAEIKAEELKEELKKAKADKKVKSTLFSKLEKEYLLKGTKTILATTNKVNNGVHKLDKNTKAIFNLKNIVFYNPETNEFFDVTNGRTKAVKVEGMTFESLAKDEGFENNTKRFEEVRQFLIRGDIAYIYDVMVAPKEKTVVNPEIELGIKHINDYVDNAVSDNTLADKIKNLATKIKDIKVLRNFYSFLTKENFESSDFNDLVRPIIGNLKSDLEIAIEEIIEAKAKAKENNTELTPNSLANYSASQLVKEYNKNKEIESETIEEYIQREFCLGNL